MPTNSYFINNLRKIHLNENDLCNALDKKLSAAALDVFENSYNGIVEITLSKEKSLITPHIGAVDPSYWKKQILPLNII